MTFHYHKVDIFGDNAIAHALLCFINRYASYNEVMIAVEDMKKTTLITLRKLIATL